MRVFLATYQSIMLTRGGPTYVLIELKKEFKKLGLEAPFFNLWKGNFEFGKDDIFHIFVADVRNYAFAKSLVKTGIKYVVSPIFFSRHSPFLIKSYRILESISRKILKGIYSEFSMVKMVCNNAELILPNTMAEANLLIKGLGVARNKIRLMYNGVEERFLHGDPSLFEKKYGMKDFILNVGHIGSERKNTFSLIKALQKIDHPAVIITDFFKNELTNECIRKARKNKNLLIVNEIAHDDPLLASAYASCKTFVLPSMFETPGIAAMEAGLAGANIVITPYGGTKEYFKDMVDYVDIYSIDSIRETILNSLNKKPNERLKEYIKKNFLWSVIAQKTVEIYKEVLNKL
ncbi:MAG: glycosyltransferase [Candidatus Cloacimonetes bacterium]|nr:glycosyltransferase [Candidatus Cloacimonadota bacterium]MCK4358635.1 glycosyltransferase [Candidatus Cloacimonadota bacterium]